MTSRRRRQVVVGVVAVGLLSLFGWQIVSWWSYEPWPELNRAVSTFPVPDGYEKIGSAAVGDRPAVCDIKPSCQDPFFWVEYKRVSGASDACTALQHSAELWQQSGFAIEVPDGSWGYDAGTDPDCIVSGELHGHGVQIFSADTEREHIIVNIG